MAARAGAAALGAHQIALQLFFFLALVLDAYAIAAQTLVGQALGGGRPDDARRDRPPGRPAGGSAPGASSPACCSRCAASCCRCSPTTPPYTTQAALVWWFLAAMQPLAGVVFALDGVLMGAGDVALPAHGDHRRRRVVGFLPLSLLALPLGWGLAGVWTGLCLFIVLRLVGVLVRVAGDRWLSGACAVTG